MCYYSFKKAPNTKWGVEVFMAHSEKFTKGAIFGVASHIERKTDRHTNEFIDVSRSHLNYSLLNDDSDLITRMNNRLAEVHVYNRKDVNVVVDWVVTLPEELKGASAGDMRDFFSNTHDFLVNRYGGLQNVVCSEIHLDESAPHLHFGFIPVVYDETREQERVQANKVIDRKELKVFHTDLHNYLKESIPGIYQEGILNGRTKNAKNVKELKELDKVIAEEKANREAILKDITAYKEPLSNFDEIAKNAKRSVFGNVQLNPTELTRLKNLVLSSQKVSEAYQVFKEKSDKKITRLTDDNSTYKDLLFESYNDIHDLNNDLRMNERDIKQLASRVDILNQEIEMLDIWVGGNAYAEMQDCSIEEYSALMMLSSMKHKDFMESEDKLIEAKDTFEKVPKSSRLFDTVSEALNLVIEKLKELANTFRISKPRL